MTGERTAEAMVMELLPNALVRVKLEGEHQLIAHFPSTQRRILFGFEWATGYAWRFRFRTEREDVFWSC